MIYQLLHKFTYEPVIVIDSIDRENEADIITQDMITFYKKFTTGIFLLLLLN